MTHFDAFFLYSDFFRQGDPGYPQGHAYLSGALQVDASVQSTTIRNTHSGIFTVSSGEFAFTQADIHYTVVVDSITNQVVESFGVMKTDKGDIDMSELDLTSYRANFLVR